MRYRLIKDDSYYRIEYETSYSEKAILNVISRWTHIKSFDLLEDAENFIEEIKEGIRQPDGIMVIKEIEV